MKTLEFPLLSSSLTQKELDAFARATLGLSENASDIQIEEIFREGRQKLLASYGLAPNANPQDIQKVLDIVINRLEQKNL